jgi:hypothetical protein
MLFDKNNVLWATTDRGVWRYDGHTPRQFTVADGLRESSNLRIYTDTLGRIWLASTNNYLYQIIGDSVRMHPMSDSIHKLGRSTGYIQQIIENKDGSIYLSFNRPYLLRLKAGEKPFRVFRHEQDTYESSIAIHYKPDEYYWDMLRFPVPDSNHRTTVYQRGGWIYLKCGIFDLKNNFRKDLCPISENEFLFSYSQKLFLIRNGRLIAEHTFSNSIIDLYVDKKGSFWAGLENEGAVRFLNGDLNSTPQRYLEGETCTGITQDHEGNYWFSTATNGIFQANTLDITVFKNLTTESKDNIITAMASDGKNIYLGTQTGQLLKGTGLPNDNYKFQTLNLPKVNGPVRKLIYTPDKHLLVFNNELYEIDTLGRPAGIKNIKSYPFEYAAKPNGEWMVSFTGSVGVFKDGRLIRTWDNRKVDSDFPFTGDLLLAMTRIRCMLLDSDYRYWMGSQNSGVFTSRDSVIYSWAERDTLFAKRTHDIIQAGENIWISIADYGLAVIRPDSSFIRITQKDGLSSDIIDVLYKENDSIVWAGTNNGLNRIILGGNSPKPAGIDYFTMREGLPSNRIFQIIQHKGAIWICTTHGAIRLNPEFSNPPDVKPAVIAGPLIVNGVPRVLEDTLTLGPRENNLVFTFKAITYRKPSTIRYRYRLINTDAEYITTSSLESRYPELNHGNYTFCLNASYSREFDPANERHFTVIIQRHWHEMLLTRILFVLLFLTLVFLVFRLILKATQMREEEKRQLLQAEKRSLLSQMNPHFIFNSLNSIQHFIVQNDQVQANSYLTNFSGLIRRILDNSKKNLIPLHEEISSLSLYLSMEKLRFENGFNYQIIKDNRIDYSETMIPPMLIQPFVENAIWHGLMPLKSNGSLLISFGHHGDYFQCRIEDNGIGRNKAALIKGTKESHISSGIQNVEERIELLNKTNKNPILLKITDLRRPDGSASGTLVEIMIPIDLNI